MSNNPVPLLVPQKGTFVSHPRRQGALGVVIDIVATGSTVLAEVQWGRRRITEQHPVEELRNGFRPSHIVQDVPRSNTRKSLGTGTVRTLRRIANRDMVLVQLHSTGESRWLPYEHLIRLRDASLKFTAAEAPEPDSSKRFRLKALAYALDSWNQVTGALDRLDVDPLPHQIDLVHRIMTSDQSNWLIADDVGLGKTIEVGLLLAAMKRRRQARRVLIVCPAGVVRQWQDEMKYKFNEDFRIYGRDFNINQPSHWATYDKVVVSIDRAKLDNHIPVFVDSGEWDVIVIDEAHHLSKIPNQAPSLRYRIAERLQHLTDRFIFLTGTPHQGQSERFVNLLLLLRPDLERRFDRVFSDPSVVADVVLRNRKSSATDANGKFLFRGQKTLLVEAPSSESAREFDERLQAYVKNGYAASQAGGATGRAIGFVMTIYRKLASSSIAAIERALERRLSRLRDDVKDGYENNQMPRLSEISDEFIEGTDGLDNLESVADGVAAEHTRAHPFFRDEQDQIIKLLESAQRIKQDDHKLKRFFSEIMDPLQRQGEQVLIFTEYRATQEYLVSSLTNRYPSSDVAQINGSMSLDEKRSNIDAFNTTAQFMVSTEAGGEGINLHERCHILANYDLPWNPSRLVQRAGRLYRYGQKERVIVFNLTSNDGFDSAVLGMMLERVLSIARDMSKVSSEFDDSLQTEIVGELLERLDVASILASNREMNMSRTEAEIGEAVDRAKNAKSQQDQLFSYVEGYNPSSVTALHSLGPNEVLAFLEGILPFKGISIDNRLHNGRTLAIRLPADMRGRYSEFPPRATNVRITVDRQIAVRDPHNISMDFASPFFRELIEFAQSPEFKGEYASIRGPEAGTLGLYKVRWQNDQGMPRWEALVPIFVNEEDGQVVANPEFFGSLLTQMDNSAPLPDNVDRSSRKRRLDRLNGAAHAELAARCTALRHPNDVALLATADLRANQ